jgi:hypothetical protein
MLPFDRVGELVGQGGRRLGPAAGSGSGSGDDDSPLVIDFAAWPLSTPRRTAGGEMYDWTGQAEISAAAQIIGLPNRSIVEGDLALKIIGAARHDFLPHVDLQLREVRAGG